jgi:hypothetical protein
VELGWDARGGHGRRRPAHMCLGDGASGELLQYRRGALGGAPRGRHRDLLPPGTPVQPRRDRGRARRCASALFRVVPPVPLASAQALRVPGARDVRAGLSDGHHVLGRHRLPHQEHAGSERGFPRHGARVGSSMVGQSPRPGRRPRRQRALGGKWRTSRRSSSSRT